MGFMQMLCIICVVIILFVALYVLSIRREPMNLRQEWKDLDNDKQIRTVHGINNDLLLQMPS